MGVGCGCLTEVKDARHVISVVTNLLRPIKVLQLSQTKTGVMFCYFVLFLKGGRFLQAQDVPLEPSELGG